MAFRCRVSGRVEGKRPVRNPWSITGFPQWNTYAGLGIVSTSMQASRATKVVKKGLPGGKSHARHRPRLDKRNLMHRMKGVNLAAEHTTRLSDMHYERAKRLTYWMSRARASVVKVLMREYEKCIIALVDIKADAHLERLIRLEDSLHEIRARVTARRYGWTM